MLTILLRNSVVCLRHSVSGCGGGGGSSRIRQSGARRSFHITRRQEGGQVQLSPYDVNLVLRENEFVYMFPEDDHSLHSYESNQLSSNNPCEDSRTEGSFIHKNGFICGIFDGHGGPACSQVVSKRLLRYIAASTVDRDILKEQLERGCTSQSFLKCHNDKVDFVKEIRSIYEDSFYKFAQSVSASHALTSRAYEIENAFLRLDEDLSDEALNNSNMRTLAVAMSGSVACVAHIENLDLHVASVGDCSAVLGSQCPDTGKWLPKKMNNEHNTDNKLEVQRICDEHPKEEADTVIRSDRLLGQLAPLRALGDFRYKWTMEQLKKYVVPAFGEHTVPPHYHTPPYLTAMPEIQHHVLGPNDKFLVLASDGLWDFMSPTQVVNLVGEHFASKKIHEPLKLPAGEVSLSNVSNVLAKRKAGRARKPLDQNAATHLLRHALGGTDFGIENSKISYYLSLAQDVVRLYRDDITITVVYFNNEYISKNSPGTSTTPAAA